MVSLESISLSVVIIINLVIAWVIASQSWQVKVNRYFVLAVLFVVLWAIGTLLLLVGGTHDLVAVGRTLFLVAPMYTILFLSLFATVFPYQKGRSFTPANAALTVLTVVFSGIIFVNPSWLVPVIELGIDGQNYLQVDTTWYTLYTVYFDLAFLIAFSELFLQIRKSTGAQRQQAIYVFAGTLAAATFSLVSNLGLPILGVSNLIWLGPTWTLFYVVTVAISIVKHQLFDVKLAAVRSVAYVCVLVTLSLIYYVIAYFMSVVVIGTHTTDSISVSPVNILLALILAFLFQPIKAFFDEFTNDVFYRSNYRSEDFFKSLSDILTSTTDLRGILERAAREIAETLKSEQAFFFLYYTNVTEHHMSAGTMKHAKLPLHDARLLDQFVRSSDERIFVTDLMEDRSSIRRMLVSHRIGIVMPLRLGDDIAGYVLLGEHRSGNYTKRDLSVLTAVNKELLIAIQNALSLHEVKELNATLQQRIDVATKELRSSNSQLKHLDEVKDEFMSMASHQLRTPLTSVKGYISMVLEGDAGKVTSQQHKLLTEAFNSSERMVGLIGDFLNVSRLQTGKFTIEKSPIDIREVIKQEIIDLELMARSHDIKLRFVAPSEPIPTIADESKIRQVVMNLIDNAIYYSPQGGTVVVTLERTSDSVAFTVVDTGIGVPQAEQARLFGKFFRAGNARKQRPDGTGVGLYLARRIVDGHGGTIIFSSKEGKGSTFGFRLPLKKAVTKVAVN